ncbi:MAG: single-stranded DNA-binding protein [Oscillatoriales cyanobacterium C42_A2020_001]|nr:single-stranded DNA-binding protein [Leptolyngbyaceae cyanobacterium C42_A2020_001]
MNTCVLMAEIVQEPELRYTPDNQTPIAEMLVQFAGLRPEDPPSTLKVIGWGNLAQEIQANYHEGDRVVIEGRLNMNTIDRPEGFKEKRAELTAQRLHRIGAGLSLESTVTVPTPATPKDTPPASRSNGTFAPRSGSSPKAKASTAKFSAPEVTPEPNLDDIPF